MKKECILRVEFNGDMFRVERVIIKGTGTFVRYRVMNRRRILGGVHYPSEKTAIEAALAAAFGCSIELSCEVVL